MERHLMIDIKDLHKSFGDTLIFEKLNLQVAKGETLAIIGFSGSGKSTLLKIIAGLEEADSGEVQLGSSKLGMSFQYSALFDSLTIGDNIAFPLCVGEDASPPPPDALNKIVNDKLALVGLQGIENLYPSELSGGMKKRISFARAIINDPEIILYDEPTAGLDPVASTIIEDLIVKLQSQTGSAGIVVTHQRSTIRRAANRVVMIYGGQVVWSGTPDELFDKDNSDKFAKQFREGDVEGPMKVNV